MAEAYPPTLAAAQARIAAVRPTAYARTRNAIDGAVSGLSPYITHGLVSLADVLAGVAARHELDVQHKFVYELGWRAYFRHVWQYRGEGILQSLHDGPLPDAAYATELPDDIRRGCTGVPAIDEPHLAPWLARWAECQAAPSLFPPVAGRCDSFSQWWARASRGLQTAADLLAVNEVPAC